MTCEPDASDPDKRLRLVVILPASWLPAIDAARGDEPRVAWLRSSVWRSLQSSGLTAGLPAWRTRRGQYDRMTKGRASDAWRRRERRRRKRREYERRWRAGEVGRAKIRRDTERRRELAAAERAARAGLGVAWEFTAEGDALASDLVGLGVAAGVVDAAGRFTQTSRYTAGQVRAALLRAMAEDAGRAWPDRWRLFAAAD